MSLTPRRIAVAILEQTLRQLIDELETALGLTRNELAHAIGAHPRSVERWRTGEAFPQNGARERLDALEKLVAHLRETFTTEDAGRTWLRESSRYLGGLSPADALRSGRIDRAEAALEAIDSGVFV
jgi:ribosome-binding protein aMBF1 (putative translation factor)